MSTEDILLRLDGDRRAFGPDEPLSGEFRLDTWTKIKPRAVELSVLWHTEGKGDEDLAVHYFYRWSSEEHEYIDFRRMQRFRTQLPESPLSYEGVFVKIRWCVRLKVFIPRGKTLLAQWDFRLGQVPSARAVLP